MAGPLNYTSTEFPIWIDSLFSEDEARLKDILFTEKQHIPKVAALWVDRDAKNAELVRQRLEILGRRYAEKWSMLYRGCDLPWGIFYLTIESESLGSQEPWVLPWKLTIPRVNDQLSSSIALSQLANRLGLTNIHFDRVKAFLRKHRQKFPKILPEILAEIETKTASTEMPEIERVLFHYGSEKELKEYILDREFLSSRDMKWIVNNLELLDAQLAFLAKKYADKWSEDYSHCFLPWKLHHIYRYLEPRVETSWKGLWAANERAIRRSLQHRDNGYGFTEFFPALSSFRERARLKNYLIKHKSKFPDIQWVQKLEIKKASASKLYSDIFMDTLLHGSEEEVKKLMLNQEVCEEIYDNMTNDNSFKNLDQIDIQERMDILARIYAEKWYENYKHLGMPWAIWRLRRYGVYIDAFSWDATVPRVAEFIRARNGNDFQTIYNHFATKHTLGEQSRFRNILHKVKKRGLLPEDFDMGVKTASSPHDNPTAKALFYGDEQAIKKVILETKSTDYDFFAWAEKNQELVGNRIELLGRLYAEKWSSEYETCLLPWGIFNLCTKAGFRTAASWTFPWKVTVPRVSNAYILSKGTLSSIANHLGVTESQLARLKHFIRKNQHKLALSDSQKEELKSKTASESSQLSPEEKYVYSKDSGTDFKRNYSDRDMFLRPSPLFLKKIVDPVWKEQFLTYIDFLGKTIGSSTMKGKTEWYPWPLYQIVTTLKSESLYWKLARGLFVSDLEGRTTIESLADRLDTTNITVLKNYIRKHYTRDQLEAMGAYPNFIKEVFSVKKASGDSIYETFLEELKAMQTPSEDPHVLENHMVLWARDPKKAEAIRQAGYKLSNALGVSTILWKLLTGLQGSTKIQVPFEFFSLSRLIDILEFLYDCQMDRGSLAGRLRRFLIRETRGWSETNPAVDKLNRILGIEKTASSEEDEKFYKEFLRVLLTHSSPPLNWVEENRQKLENFLILWSTNPSKVSEIKDAALKGKRGVFTLVLWGLLAQNVKVPYSLIPLEHMCRIMESNIHFQGMCWRLFPRFKAFLRRELKGDYTSLKDKYPVLYAEMIEKPKKASKEEDEEYFERFIGSLECGDRKLPHSFTSDLPRLESYMAMWAINPTKQQEILKASIKSRQGAFVSILLWDLVEDSKIKVPFSFFPIDRLCDLMERNLGYFEEETLYSRFKVYVRKLYKNNFLFRTAIDNGSWPEIRKRTLKLK